MTSFVCHYQTIYKKAKGGTLERASRARWWGAESLGAASWLDFLRSEGLKKIFSIIEPSAIVGKMLKLGAVSYKDSPAPVGKISTDGFIAVRKDLYYHNSS